MGPERYCDLPKVTQPANSSLEATQSCQIAGPALFHFAPRPSPPPPPSLFRPSLASLPGGGRATWWAGKRQPPSARAAAPAGQCCTAPRSVPAGAAARWPAPRAGGVPTAGRRQRRRSGARADPAHHALGARAAGRGSGDPALVAGPAAPGRHRDDAAPRGARRSHGQVQRALYAGRLLLPAAGERGGVGPRPRVGATRGAGWPGGACPARAGLSLCVRSSPQPRARAHGPARLGCTRRLVLCAWAPAGAAPRDCGSLGFGGVSEAGLYTRRGL